MAAPLLEQSVEINATPAKVWELVSDMRRFPEWSPQTAKTFVLGGGDIAVGKRTFNINRRGPLVWPTRAKVIDFDRDKQIRFRILDNKTTWSFTIEPTDAGVTLIQKREAPNGAAWISSTLIDKLMGGGENFDEELKVGMAETLGHIKRLAES